MEKTRAFEGNADLNRRSLAKILIDEADMADCAEIYNQRTEQGKWLFDNDGLPMLAQALAAARAVTADRFFRPFQLCACLGGRAPDSAGGYDPCPNGCDNGLIWLG